MKIITDVGKVLTNYDTNVNIENKLINISNSLETLSKWKSNGFEIYICSFLCSEKKAYKRINRLKSDGHNGLFNAQYYVTNKLYKKDIAGYIDGDIMIDDNEEILNQIKLLYPHIVTILFQEFNLLKKKSNKKHFVANNWIQVDKLVDQIMKKFDQKIFLSNCNLLVNKYSVKELDENIYFVDE